MSETLVARCEIRLEGPTANNAAHGLPHYSGPGVHDGNKWGLPTDAMFVGLTVPQRCEERPLDSHHFFGLARFYITPSSLTYGSVEDEGIVIWQPVPIDQYLLYVRWGQLTYDLYYMGVGSHIILTGTDVVSGKACRVVQPGKPRIWADIYSAQDLEVWLED